MVIPYHWRGDLVCVCVFVSCSSRGGSLLLLSSEHEPNCEAQGPRIQEPRMAVPSRALLEVRLALAKKKKKEKKEKEKAAHRRAVERRRQQKKEKKEKEKTNNEDKKKEVLHIFKYSPPVPPFFIPSQEPKKVKAETDVKKELKF
jgi:hypothetical protein